MRAGNSHLQTPVLWLQGHNHAQLLHVGAGDPNSDPFACIAVIVLMELSPVHGLSSMCPYMMLLPFLCLEFIQNFPDKS